MRRIPIHPFVPVLQFVMGSGLHLYFPVREIGLLHHVAGGVGFISGVLVESQSHFVDYLLVDAGTVLGFELFVGERRVVLVFSFGGLAFEEEFLGVNPARVDYFLGTGGVQES